MRKRAIRIPFGFHVIDGATGRPMGRPRKEFGELGRTGRIERAKADLRAMLSDPEAEVDVDCSGPEDWARERREREEALERVRKHVNKCATDIRGWGYGG